MLAPFKLPIRTYLLSFIEEQRTALPKTYWTSDVVDRFLTMSKSGKVFRGSLFLATYEMLSDASSADMIPGAASLEIMNAALLIHDDIIDRDDLRRGAPSMVKQYQDAAAALAYPSSDHLGLSLAICVGDIGIFWGFELLNRLPLPPEQKNQIVSFFSREYCIVGLGEMLDVHQTATSKVITEKEIIKLYRYKTARYTFTLPMVLGGYAAQASPELITQLDELGEVLGLLYQIKDDELGLFGSEQETGKPVTSDVKEGKKTLYHHYVFQLATGSTQQRLKKLFGKVDLTLEELEEVRSVIIKSGTKKLVDSYLEKYEQQALQQISALPLSSQKQDALKNLVTQLVHRNR